MAGNGRVTIWGHALLLTLLGGSVARVVLGAESVYLRNGFTLEVESHIQEGQNYVCRSGGGTTEIPVSAVVRIEGFSAPEELTDEPWSEKSRGEVQTSVSAEAIVRKAASEQGLTEDFVYSVAKVESGLKQSSVSSKGALGLMQLMPSTALVLGVDPARADGNAVGGAKYLRELLLRYQGNSALALAAYNAGPGAVAKYRGVPPYAETRMYIQRVLNEYERQIKARANAKLKASRHGSASNPIAID